MERVVARTERGVVRGVHKREGDRLAAGSENSDSPAGVPAESGGVGTLSASPAVPRISHFGSMRNALGRSGKASVRRNRQTLVRPHSMAVTEHAKGRFFSEARPVVGGTYFAASSASTAVVIALYNEGGPDLARTIESLAASGIALDVVIVADGIAKLSDSMRRYLAHTFHLESCQEVMHADSQAWGASDQIFISDPVKIGSSGSSFAVLLKRYNHKKINTQSVPARASVCTRPADAGPHAAHRHPHVTGDGVCSRLACRSLPLPRTASGSSARTAPTRAASSRSPPTRGRSSATAPCARWSSTWLGIRTSRR